MSIKFCLALLAVLYAVSPSLAQTQSDDVVRITTNLVHIDAVVTKKGKPVTDLKAEDFEIYEDGRLQTITSFVYVSNVSNNAEVSGTPGTSGQDPNTPSDPNAPPRPMISGIDLKIVLIVDQEPAYLLRYQIRAITARLQQLSNGHATVSRRCHCLANRALKLSTSSFAS
jgi:hypothetical protein